MKCLLKNYTNLWLKHSKEQKCMLDLKIYLGAGLAENGTSSCKDLSDKYLLCVIDVFTKYDWKDKKER